MKRKENGKKRGGERGDKERAKSAFGFLANAHNPIVGVKSTSFILRPLGALRWPLVTNKP